MIMMGNNNECHYLGLDPDYKDNDSDICDDGENICQIQMRLMMVIRMRMMKTLIKAIILTMTISFVRLRTMVKIMTICQ